MSRYQPYPSYKASGVEWLGEVPEHWEAKKLKYNLGLQTQKITISGQIVIALENIESKSGKYIATESSYQGEDVAFKSGDILFGKLRPYLAKVYKCDSNGVAFGDLLTYRPTKDFDSSFAFYSLLSDEFIKIVDSSTYGTKMPRASAEFINEMILATPSHEEQTAIANFLDIQTAKIDTLIAKQKQMIELLGEKRSALISHAVTKGINPNMAMKDSGVEWLGEVPEHWEIKNAKYVLNDNLGIKIGPFGSALKLDDMVASGYKVYGQENVIGNDFSLGQRYISDTKFTEMIVYKVEPKDILITMMGTIGKCQVVPDCIDTGIIDSHLIKLRMNTLMLPDYFVILIDQSNLVKTQFALQSKGSIMQGLNSTIIKGLLLPVPPISEQDDIMNYLNVQTSKIDTLVEKACRAIELMKERRTALIFATVTGKIDVRGIH